VSCRARSAVPLCQVRDGPPQAPGPSHGGKAPLGPPGRPGARYQRAHRPITRPTAGLHPQPQPVVPGAWLSHPGPLPTLPPPRPGNHLYPFMVPKMVYYCEDPKGAPRMKELRHTKSPGSCMGLQTELREGLEYMITSQRSTPKGPADFGPSQSPHLPHFPTQPIPSTSPSANRSYFH
jgi:hypothetical protein